MNLSAFAVLNKHNVYVFGVLTERVSERRSGKRDTGIGLHINVIGRIYKYQYHSSFLDLLLEIDKDSRLRVKIYDKRDDFNFDIVNFPFLCGNIPQSPSYGVYISQLIRYARASTLYDDFLSRSCRLTS